MNTSLTSLYPNRSLCAWCRSLLWVSGETHEYTLTTVSMA